MLQLLCQSSTGRQADQHRHLLHAVVRGVAGLLRFQIAQHRGLAAHADADHTCSCCEVLVGVKKSKSCFGGSKVCTQACMGVGCHLPVLYGTNFDNGHLCW